MKYIKLIVATVSLVMLMSAGAASANGFSSASRIRVDITATSFVGEACSGLQQISTTASCSTGAGQNTFNNIAKTVVNVLSIIIGIVSIIMILISGFRFIVAGGESNAVSGARTTLIYALIGLAIAVLAQFLVHEVLNTATTIQNSSYLNSRSSINYDS